MNVCKIENGNCSPDSNRHLDKGNKLALKVIGVIDHDVSQENFLEFISEYVNPNTIQAFFYDSFNSFYTLCLNDIDSFCKLVGKKASMGSYTIKFLPLLDFYVVDNVYPFIANEDLCRTFDSFGRVFQVTNYHILPNSSKFSHILSGKREISFILPGEKSELNIPINVFHSPYRYHVRKLCSACVTEGHSVLYCPDIEEDFKSESPEEDSSDSELDSILKTGIPELLNTSYSAHEDIKEEPDPMDVACGPDIINSQSLTSPVSPDKTTLISNQNGGSHSLTSPLSAEKTNLTSNQNEAAEDTALNVQLEFSSESPQKAEESIKNVGEDHLQKSYVTNCAEKTQEASTSKDSQNFQSGYLHEKSFKKKKHIQDNVSKTENSVDDLRNGSELISPKCIPSAVKCNGSSSFLKAFLRKRKLKEGFYTFDLLNKGSEDSEESEEGSNNKNIARKRRHKKRTSMTDDVLIIEGSENGNHESYNAQGLRRKSRKVIWKLSPEAEEIINDSVGVLPPQALRDILLCDGRNPSALQNRVLMHTPNFKAVDEQLKQLHRQFHLSKRLPSYKYRILRKKIIKLRQVVLTYE